MTPKLLLRIAAFLVLFGATGHTIGHFTRKETDNPAQKAVFKAMEQKFNQFGSFRSWDDFYVGLSLEMALTLFIFMVMLWVLSGNTEKYPGLCKKLLLLLLISFAGYTIIAYFYIFTIPAVTTLLVSVLLVTAIIKLKSTPLKNIS
jgi:hypothetical protein